MTDKQYGDAQRLIGRLEGLAEGLDLVKNNEPLKEFLTITTDTLVSLVNELYHPREELRKRIEELKLKAGGNYDVKVDDDRPHSYL